MMDAIKVDQIDELILEEKKSIAIEYFQNAWEAASEEGLEPHLMAETFVQQALLSLVNADGDAAANSVIDGIRAMEVNGEFLLNKTIQ